MKIGVKKVHWSQSRDSRLGQASVRGLNGWNSSLLSVQSVDVNSFLVFRRRRILIYLTSLSLNSMNGNGDEYEQEYLRSSSYFFIKFFKIEPLEATELPSSRIFVNNFVGSSQFHSIKGSSQASIQAS